MSTTTATAGVSRLLAWRFPETLNTRSEALGLPADTVVHALGRRWLADGAGRFWPGGRSNGIFVRELLAGGPARVGSLPAIAAGDEVSVLATHLLNALLAAAAISPAPPTRRCSPPSPPTVPAERTPRCATFSPPPAPAGSSTG